MKIILIIVGAIALLIMGFIVYRFFAFKRESRQHLQLQLERLETIYIKLESGDTPTEDELHKYSSDIKTRFSLYKMLAEYDKTELFPKAFYTVEQAAESNLANWLEFPTELGSLPDEIEYLKKQTIELEGNNVNYHVYKFRVNEPHWSAKDGWMLGVVGPYFDDSSPYSFPQATFSRLSKLEEVKPEDEVQWVHENISGEISAPLVKRTES